MEQRERSGEAFEQLWLMRHCYPLRSDYDTRPTLSVDQAIAYGEQLLRLAHVRHRWRDRGRLIMRPEAPPAG